MSVLLLVFTAEVNALSVFFGNDISDKQWGEEITDIALALTSALIVGFVNALSYDGSIDFGDYKILGVTIPSDIVTGVAINTAFSAITISIDERLDY